MSNAITSSFQFTSDEHTFITKFLQRKLKLARRPKERKDTVKTRKVMSTLLDRVIESKEPTLNRREIKLIDQIARNHYERVVASVVPELQRRIDNGGELTERYKRDLVKVNAKIKMLEDLMNRLQERL